MQILHPSAGSIQHTPSISSTQITIDRNAVPNANVWLLQAHGVAVAAVCLALPAFRVSVICRFLFASLLHGRTLKAAALAAAQADMPYQRGQFWIRRFRAQATGLCAALAALTVTAAVADFVARALQMLEAIVRVRGPSLRI